MLVLSLASSSALAQPAGGVAYLEAGPIVTTQDGPSGTVSETYVTAPGGTAIGWLVAGGVHVGRAASVLAEWSSTGRMTATEPSRYFTTYQEERRDRFLTLGLRLHVALSSAVTLEPMGGVAFVYPQGWSQAIYTDPLAPRPSQPRVAHRLNAAAGPVFGLDAAIGGRRVALVPSFRMLRSAVSKGRYDDMPTSPEVEISSIYPGGYPAWTLRMSVAARVGL